MSAPAALSPDPLLEPARLALACLDLTSLNDHDTPADVQRLCHRATGPHGRVAAVCVWPAFAAMARAHLPADVAVAAVANFPTGNASADAVARDVAAIAEAGAQEVDVVLPWQALLAGDVARVVDVLRAARRESPGLRLKVILETGALPARDAVDHAARLALDAGADFLKTSTGRVPVGATPDAVATLLAAVAAWDPSNTGVGIKVSGGVRRVADAAGYLRQVADAWGAAAIGPARVRLGASGLLDDIRAVLDGRTATGSAAGY